MYGIIYIARSYKFLMFICYVPFGWKMYDMHQVSKEVCVQRAQQILLIICKATIFVNIIIFDDYVLSLIVLSFKNDVSQFSITCMLGS